MTAPSPPDLQSGAVPFRWRAGGLEVLLTTSITSKRWICPKGNIALGLTSRASAVKEAFEEAGIRGYTFPRPLGIYEHKTKKHGRRPVELYPMEVLYIDLRWPEKAARRRKWFRLDVAAAKVQEKGLPELLLALPRYLAHEHADHGETAPLTP